MIPTVSLVIPSKEGPKPMVHDLMAQALAQPGDFVGFLNADVTMTEAFHSSQSRWRGFDAIRVRRTDVRGEEHIPVKTTSAEGIIIRRDVWERLGNSYPPGMVLGEPGWDTCWVMWLHHHGLRVGRLDNGEVLHPWHEPTWKSKPYRSWENVQIMMSWLADVKGKMRAWRIMNYPTTYWEDLDEKEEVL